LKKLTNAEILSKSGGKFKFSRMLMQKCELKYSEEPREEFLKGRDENASLKSEPIETVTKETKNYKSKTNSQWHRWLP
jgi:hypothetical protein